MNIVSEEKMGKP